MIAFARFASLLAVGFALAGPVSAADALPKLTQLLAESSDAQFQLDVLRGLSDALKGRRTAPMPAGWEAVEAKLADSANADVRTLTQTLSLTFGSPRARTSLRATAANPQAEAGARRTALDSLLAIRDPDLPKLLQKIVADPAVRAQAIRGLAAFDDAGTPGAILAVYSQLAPAERRDALNALAARVAFAKPLLAAIAANQVPKADLTADLVRQLRGLKDEGLRADLTKLWGVMKETSPDMEADIAKMKKAYWAGGSTPGDAPRGRVVFNKVCAQCHRLFDTGGNVGPDITGANRGDLDYLLQNILFPNAVIPNEYRASTIETKDGRVVMGVVKSQDATAYVVQTATELVTIPKAEVDKVEESEQSMMPEGMLAQLPETEMRDLLYYLTRPGQVPLPK
jgi:putative heme-binding domain-containing protein